MYTILLVFLACAKFDADAVDTATTSVVDESPGTPVPTAFYKDVDGDGYGDPATVIEVSGVSGGNYVTTGGDCDDTNATVHPGANEVCNSIDDNCDGSVDDNADEASKWYLDGDGDGWGDPQYSMESCAGDPRYVDNNDDCDDMNAASFPGNDKYCDGVDNDCDGSVDEAGTADGMLYYGDGDGDGYGGDGKETSYIMACKQPSGFSQNQDDCDDTDATLHPKADEYCDGVDNDCDGSVDEDGAVDGQPYYPDVDADGHGEMASVPLLACSPPEFLAAIDDDCDDYDPRVYPDAEEICDDQDNDCDGMVDDGVEVKWTWYRDQDGDGFGSNADTVMSCSWPTGYWWIGDDCDDFHPDINPDVDGDGDGFDACDDCDDADWHVNADAVESKNGYDDDCDGSVDEADIE